MSDKKEKVREKAKKRVSRLLKESGDDPTVRRNSKRRGRFMRQAGIASTQGVKDAEKTALKSASAKGVVDAIFHSNRFQQIADVIDVNAGKRHKTTRDRELTRRRVEAAKKELEARKKKK